MRLSGITLNRPFTLTMLSALLAIFHLTTTYFGTLPNLLQRDIHWLLISVIILVATFGGRSKKRWRNAIDVMLVIGAVVTGWYLYANYDSILANYGSVNYTEVVLGLAAVAIILETARRALGWALPIITLAFILYSFLGPWLPGMLGHRGSEFGRFFSYMFTSPEGIYGMALGTSANIIFLYVLFGSFLANTKAGDLFIKVAYALTGRISGGPALTAVTGSALLGTISGSSVANATTVGVFTIPLMKRNGYSPHFAAAVEAVASTGGQIMPPVMGAAAFLMADMLGVKYQTIALAALVPAVFYFLTVGLVVYFKAKYDHLKPLTKEEVPSIRKTLKEGYLYFVPVIVLIWILFLGYSANRAAFYAILSVVIIGVVKRDLANVRKILSAMEEAAKSMMSVASACACAGIIMGVIGLTGIGTKLSVLIEQWSDGNLLLALLLTMIVSLILGMGLPSTVCYLVLAVLAAPALTKMGLAPLTAHMFVFYFGLISAITPPVALTAYAAAGIAGCSPMKAGFTAFMIAIVSFLIPYVFVYNPAFMLNGTWLEIGLSIAVTLIGCLALAGAIAGWFFGHFNMVTRGLLFISSILIIVPETITTIIGCAMMVITMIFNRIFFVRNHRNLWQKETVL